MRAQTLTLLLGALCAVPAAAAPQVYELTIADGSGASSWNTPGTKLVMHVGDTLHIHNMDATSRHTLHTSGAPCPHGGSFVYDATGQKVNEGYNFDNIPVGGWLDCVLGEAFDNDQDEVYDHFQYDGSDGRFFFTVLP